MVSVVCPVFNEEEHIDQLLHFLVSADLPEKEMILVDGGSSDRTLPKIMEWRQKYPFIKVLSNTKRYVPYALNMAIREAKGNIIVRLDAHTKYAPDYFDRIMDAFLKSGADIVGGPMRTASGSPVQEAMAYAMCTAFGMGDSKVHQEEYEGQSDSVAYGAWKKAIFRTTGLFDEALKRNQDDEFHYRARSKGFTVFQDPAIKLYYYPRKTFKAVFRQYLEYGIYKPLVLMKVRSGAQLRHFIPSCFALYLLSTPFSFYFAPWLLPMGIYLLADLYFTVRNRLSIPVRWRLFWLYPTIHLAYGTGFILGLGKVFRK